ncbi:hypothetical protein OFN51_40215, partial [Escherichia coli]|nr:hypothetical protein [Escherichia coli]
AIPEDPSAAAILETTLAELDNWPELVEERNKYEKICCSPELLTQIARTPISFISANANISETLSAQPSSSVSHNELDEFLL